MAMTAGSGQHGQRHPADPAAAVAERLFLATWSARWNFSTVYLGERLGLYRAPHADGPATSAEAGCADRHGGALHQRMA